MIWIELPDPLPEMKIWGAREGKWQYVLSHDEAYHSWGASAKRVDKPHSQKIVIGDAFATREDAEAAIQVYAESH